MDRNLLNALVSGALQPVVVVEPPKPKLEPMKKIKAFREGMLPLVDITRFTNDVNALIERYNALGDEVNKNTRIVILEQIQEKIKEIDYKFKPDSIAASEDYREVCANLFIDIQKQYVSMGRTMLKANNSKASLAELIANKHPAFMDKFSAVLVKSRTFKLNEELEALCEKHMENEDTLESALALKEFLKKNEISFLGGGNSRNYLVTKIDTQEKEVLKVDHRLDMPRNVESHLRDKMFDSFTAIGAERRIAVTVKGEVTGRTLLVTEYCSKGNLQDHSKILDGMAQNQATKHIGLIFQQMAANMLKIQAAGCLFSDGKICNWLLDDKNRLRIADTKSFVFVDAKGDYSATLPGNEHCSFLTTKKFNPPEYKHKIRNAESTHAFLLGLNLYVFITGLQPPTEENGTRFSYNQELFQSPEGQHLKALISGLVNEDPQARLSVKEAHHELFLLAAPELRAVFAELKNLKLCKNDAIMDEYIRDKQQQISNAPNLVERERILTEINTTIAALKANKPLKDVQDIIGTLKIEAQKRYNYGKGAKAEKIEKALVELSLNDRIKFDPTQAAAKKVMEALASKRTIGGVKDVILTDKNEIQIKDVPGTFRKFKERFQKETAVQPAAGAIDRPAPGL